MTSNWVNPNSDWLTLTLTLVLEPYIQAEAVIFCYMLVHCDVKLQIFPAAIGLQTVNRAILIYFFTIPAMS